MLGKFLKSSQQQEVADTRSASHQGGSVPPLISSRSTIHCLFYSAPTYVGIELAPEDLLELQNLHLGALADQKQQRYLQMEYKYTKILDKLKLCFNDYKINQKGFSSKTAAIQNLVSIAYLNRGIARFEQTMFREAIEDFSKLVKLDVTNLYAFYHRALAYYAQGDVQLATSDLHVVEDTPLTWNLDLNLISNSINTFENSEPVSTDKLEPLPLDSPLNALFFYAPNELRYLSHFGVCETVIIQNMSVFIAKAQTRFKARPSSSTSQKPASLTAEDLIQGLGVTLPYFPRVLSDNASLKLAVYRSDWDYTKLFAQSLITALPNEESRSDEEVLAAFELRKIIQTAEEKISNPRVNDLLKPKPRYGLKSWGLYNHKTVPTATPSFDSAKTFFNPINSLDSPKKSARSFNLFSLGNPEESTTATILRPTAPNLPNEHSETKEESYNADISAFGCPT